MLFPEPLFFWLYGQISLVLLTLVFVLSIMPPDDRRDGDP